MMARVSEGFKGLSTDKLGKKEQDDVSETEQLITAGAALEQFLLALKAQGFASIVLSGLALKAPEVQAAFIQSPSEQVLAWITCGTAKEDTPQAEKETRDGPLSVWNL